MQTRLRVTSGRQVNTRKLVSRKFLLTAAAASASAVPSQHEATILTLDFIYYSFTRADAKEEKQRNGTASSRFYDVKQLQRRSSFVRSIDFRGEERDEEEEK